MGFKIVESKCSLFCLSHTNLPERCCVSTISLTRGVVYPHLLDATYSRKCDMLDSSSIPVKERLRGTRYVGTRLRRWWGSGVDKSVDFLTHLSVVSTDVNNKFVRRVTWTTP